MGLESLSAATRNTKNVSGDSVPETRIIRPPIHRMRTTAPASSSSESGVPMRAYFFERTMLRK